MHKKWQILQYGLVLGMVCLAVWLIMYFQSSDTFWKGFAVELKDPVAILILQLIVIVAVTRIFGYVCSLIGQPSVIGQIIAGIVLGPSLMGYIFPELSTFLFSAESLKSLKLLSTLGLIFFMFIVGMEIDINALKHKAKQAVAISNAGIMIPFMLGILISFPLYQIYASDNVQFISFSLFMGIAMSITAFPVLARIVQERGITQTPLGSLALICAASDDVTAWCMLVAVIAIATAGSIYSALLTLVLSILYVLCMLKIVRPLLQKFAETYLESPKLHKTKVTILFLVMLISAYITKLIGIHELFGAFMAGIVMPHNITFKKKFTEKIEDVSLVLLLPLFFVFSGLRTHLGLLTGWYAWMICLAVITIATIGKFGGCFIAAKFTGESWKNSLSIGMLMNTRGLMELVVLNIGYDLKILGPEIFTTLVMMALVTTCLTNPGLNLINKFFEEPQSPSPPEI